VFEDFNNDGVKAIFLAAHRYDASPFPGEPDILVPSTNGGYTQVQPKPTTLTSFTHSVDTGDIDGDGIFETTTDGLPASYVGNNFPARSTATLLTDINNNGYLDLIRGTNGSPGQRSYIYFGGASGTFTDANRLVLPTFPAGNPNQIGGDIQAIDYDQDGDKDLILSNTRNNPF